MINWKTWNKKIILIAGIMVSLALTACSANNQNQSVENTSEGELMRNTVRFVIGDMEVYQANSGEKRKLDMNDKIISELAGLKDNNGENAVWYIRGSEGNNVFDFQSEITENMEVYVADGECSDSQHFWNLAEEIRKETRTIDETAFSYYKIAFVLGNEESSNYIAEAYVNGTGVEQNVEEGIAWYEKAVNELNLSRAYLNYALLFYNGVKNADGSNGWACEPDYQKAFDLFLQAYENGHMKAARYVGIYYEQGLGGIEINCETAKEWYEKGIESGDITSSGLLGNLYLNQKMGKGSPASFRGIAYNYYMEAIKANAMKNGEEPEAVAEAISSNLSPYKEIIFGLGYCWEYGWEGAEPDYDEALFWYGLGKGTEACDEAINRVNRRLAGEEVEWDTSFGGADKILDTELLEVRRELAAQFIAFDGENAFFDERTGTALPYNIYLPENYSEDKEYPVVFFIHDGSVIGRRIEAPLMQGWGAIIWTSKENQKKNECIVVAPVFPTTDENNAETAVDLMEYLKTKYSFDENRLYLTGQSFGCITSFDINVRFPDYFTATFYVSGQWDHVSEEDRVKIASQKFIYSAAQGDEEAIPGMEAVKTMLEKQSVAFGETQFSASVSVEEQSAAVREMTIKGNNINLIVFDKDTVPIYGTPKGEAYNAHMYAFDAGYKLDAAREWLFSQTK